MKKEISYIVRFVFDDPNMSEDAIEAIVWGCTGYPLFWGGKHSYSPVRCFVRQLYHAKRSLAKGFTIDDISAGKDRRK